MITIYTIQELIKGDIFQFTYFENFIEKVKELTGLEIPITITYVNKI